MTYFKNFLDLMGKFLPKIEFKIIFRVENFIVHVAKILPKFFYLLDMIHQKNYQIYRNLPKKETVFLMNYFTF